ncbi:hypothetical protein M4D81_31870 [Paenibacillus sp. p3-SID867]|uniref:hypothetical protein n=1 Tax=Paenibacillus sp. p3-SID867 TaxID=2916363 RepID=UPI0021A2E639|nr:hypothetical protein [Paenibacillus sp. p3-SID867]MCT1403606.1 hypothetical protein [Paenibacillus sp. p3-SID867]
MDQCDKEPTSLTLDDYLDLLSLAIRLEDRKWQADIVRTLRHMLEPQDKKQAKSEECTEQELWQCVNQINDRMFALYNELKATDDKDMQRKLLDQMWELKIARVEVFRKIRSIYQ